MKKKPTYVVEQKLPATPEGREKFYKALAKVQLKLAEIGSRGRKQKRKAA